MSNNPNLWWAYDSESNSFGALPASPFLLPALAIMGVLSLFGFGRVRVSSNAEMLGEFGKSSEYRKCEARYNELEEKERRGWELSTEELLEMDRLNHPKWNAYKLWHY